MSVVAEIAGHLRVRQLAIVFGIDFQRVAVEPQHAGLRAAQFDETMLLLHVGGPAEFNLQDGAVVEADHAHGEILHVERAAGLLVAEIAVDGIRNIVVGEFAERVAGDGDRRRIAHQPDGQVDHVDAPIDQWAAAGLRLRREPSALSGDAAAALPCAAAGVDFAHAAVVDVLLDVLRDIHEAVVAHDHQQLAGLFGGFLHGDRLFGADGVRLLAEDVLAVREGRDGDFRMEVVRRADIDAVDILPRDEIAVVRIDGRLRIAVADEAFRPLLDNVADRDDFHAFVILVEWIMCPAGDSAATDDTDIVSVHVCSFLIMG